LVAAQGIAAEELILRRIADRRCLHYSLGRPDIPIYIDKTSYGFGCAVSAGHSIAARITRYADAAAAQDAFTLARGENSLGSFHGYPAYEWSGPSYPPPMTEHGYSYQIDRWVIWMRSQDDTHFWAALPAEDIYQLAAVYCLFPGQVCRIYLPLIE
jgi:hypothetical protein